MRTSGAARWIECAEAYEAAAARAADAGSTSAQVHALSGLIRPFAVLDPDRGMAAIEQAVRLSATLDDPLLHARTELLAAGIRLTYDTWRTKDWEICASASETIHRLSDAGPPAFDRVIYAHLQVLRGDYAEALENLEAGIPRENESTSIDGAHVCAQRKNAGSAVFGPAWRAGATAARRKGHRREERQ